MMTGAASVVGGTLVIFGFAGVGIYLFAAGALSSTNFYGTYTPLSYLLFIWNVVTYGLLVLAGIALILLDRKG